MRIARTVSELEAALAVLGPVALVPTMGALHDGHLSLVRAANPAQGPVAASIFVNPLQFAPSEDFSSYPRDEADDLAKLESAGCALAWVPEVGLMYPPDAASQVVVGGPAEGFEGAARPAHFTGVATVVLKLFGQLRPHTAWFGEKDWQQVQVVRRMVADFLIPVRVAAAPTLREADGLAMSSRNRFLDPADRAKAPAMYAALVRAAAALAAGSQVQAVTASAEQDLTAAGLAPDYVALVDAVSLRPLEYARPPARLLAAARLGRVRLLDNVAVDVPAG